VARSESRYVCGTCGASTLRWEGQCRGCGNWNTLVETQAERVRPGRRHAAAIPPPTIDRLAEPAGQAVEPDRIAEALQALANAAVDHLDAV
jgi:DNA repair protein RadA/Sms